MYVNSVEQSVGMRMGLKGNITARGLTSGTFVPTITWLAFDERCRALGRTDLFVPHMVTRTA